MLRDELKHSYRLIRGSAINVNSPINRALRQAWAVRFLKPDVAKKVVINVDETWLDHTDFRRRKWSKRGQKSTLPKKTLQPRISLIVSVDTEGNVYYAVSQAKNNSDTMGVFF